MPADLTQTLAPPVEEELPPEQQPVPEPPPQQAAPQQAPPQQAPVEQAPVDQAPVSRGLGEGAPQYPDEPAVQGPAPVYDEQLDGAPAGPPPDEGTTIYDSYEDMGGGPQPVNAEPAGGGSNLNATLAPPPEEGSPEAEQAATAEVPPPAPPPPPGPFTSFVEGARDALGGAVEPAMEQAPELVQNVGAALGKGVGGAADITTGVTTALGQGNVTGAFEKSMEGLSGPQMQGVEDVTERISQGLGALPAGMEEGISQVVSDPSNILGIYEGAMTTYGPAAIYSGVTYQDWWDQNPQRAQNIMDTEGAQGAHEAWLTDIGASSVPPPTLTNPWDAMTADNPLEKAGQFVGALPTAVGGYKDLAGQGQLEPFLVNQLQQLAEDPTILTGKFTEPLGEAAIGKTIGAVKKIPGVGGLTDLSESSARTLAGEQIGAAATEQIGGMQAALEEPPGWRPGAAVPTPEEGLPPSTVRINPDGSRIEEVRGIPDSSGNTVSHNVYGPDGNLIYQTKTFDDAMHYLDTNAETKFQEAKTQQRLRDARFQDTLAERGGATPKTESPLSGITRTAPAEHPLFRELTHTFEQSGLTSDYTFRLVNKLSDVYGQDMLGKIGAGPSAVTDPTRKLITVALDHARNADFEDLGLSPAESQRMRVKTDLDHEIMHAVDNLGLWNPTERRILLDAAQAHGINEQMSGFYRGLTGPAHEAEMLAHLYQFYREGKLLADSPAAPLLERLRQFLTGLGRGLRNTYPEELLRSVETGDVVRRRPSGVTSGGEPAFATRATTRPGANRLGLSLAEKAEREGPVTTSDVRQALRDSVNPYNLTREEYQHLQGSPEAAQALRTRLTTEGYDSIVVWDGDPKMGIGGRVAEAELGRVHDVVTFHDPVLRKVQFSERPETVRPEAMRQGFRNAGLEIGERDGQFNSRFRTLLTGLDPAQTIQTLNEPFMRLDAPTLREAMTELGKGRDWVKESAKRMDDAIAFAKSLYGEDVVNAAIAKARKGGGKIKGTGKNALKPPSMASYDAMLRQAMGHLYWYDISGKAFDEVGLPIKDTRDLIDLTAATSGGEVPLTNERLALAFKSEQLRGEAGWIGMRDTSSVEAVMQGQGLYGPKFNNFSRNIAQQTQQLRGTLNATELEALPTVDMWHFRAYNVPPAIGAGAEPLYAIIAHHTITEAAALEEALGQHFTPVGGQVPKMEHRFMQAGVWVLGRVNEGFDKKNMVLAPFEEGTDYWSVMNKIKGELDKALPELGLANRSLEYRDFLHPLFAQELTKYGIHNYETSRHGLLEMATDNTVSGQRLTELMHNLRRIPPGTTVKMGRSTVDVWDAVLNGRAGVRGVGKIQQGAFKSLLAGGVNSPISKMVQGLTGIKDLAISRILPYGQGSWGGVISPNVDIPLYGRTRGGTGDIFMFDREVSGQLMAAVSHAFYQDGRAWNSWNTAIEHGTGNSWIIENPQFHLEVSAAGGRKLKPESVDFLTALGTRLNHATATASSPLTTQIRLIPTEKSVPVTREQIAQAITAAGMDHLEFDIKEALHDSSFTEPHAEYGYAHEFGGGPVSGSPLAGRGEDPLLVGARLATADRTGSLRQSFNDALEQARGIADGANSDIQTSVDALRPIIEAALADSGALWDTPPQVSDRIAQLETIGGTARNFPMPSELAKKLEAEWYQFSARAAFADVGDEYRRTVEREMPYVPRISGTVIVSDAAKTMLDQEAGGRLHFRDGSRPTGTIRDISTQTYSDLNSWIQGFDANGTVLPWAERSSQWQRWNKQFNPDGTADITSMTYGAGAPNLETAHARARADYAIGVMNDAAQRGARGDIVKRNPLTAAIAEHTNAVRVAMLFNVLNAPRYVLQNLTSNTLNIAARGGGLGVASEVFTDFGEMGRVFRSQRDVAARTHLDSLLKEAGVGDRPNMRQSARTYLARDTPGGADRSAMGKGIDRALRLIAPETLRYAMSVPDILAREKVGSHAIYQGFGELNTKLPALLEQHLHRQGIAHLIPPERLHAVLTDFLNSKRTRIDLNTGLPETGLTGKISRYEPVWGADELKAHLVQNLTRDLRTAPDPGQLNRALNDFQHTTKNEVRRVIDEADAQVDHALFSWRDTKGDEYLKKAFLFHYWSSRQGGFYVAEGLKRPYLIAAYGRMMNEMSEQAEELGAPDWMKGWFQFMNTPGGLSIWYSPFDTIGSLLTMADWQSGMDESPYRDLTELGKKWEAMPFMVHPGLTMVAYSLGLLGPDARAPALTGTETFASRAIDLLNLANASDAGFMAPFNAAGIGVDASGNKIPLAKRPLQDLYAHVGNAISSALQPITHLSPVEVVPSTGAIDANIISIGEAEVRRQHPEWDDGSTAGQMWINRTVTDTIDDPGSSTYQDWYRQAARLPFELADGMPLPLAALARMASPIQIRATPEQQALDQMEGLKPKGDMSMRGPVDPLDPQASFIWDEAHYGRSSTVEARRLNEWKNEFYNVVPPDLEAARADAVAITSCKDAESCYLSHPITIGDTIYEPENLQEMEDDQRWAVRADYLASKGYDEEAVQGAYTAKNQYLADHPDLAAYMQWDDLIRASAPDGTEAEQYQAFSEQMAAINPSFAQYLQSSMTDHITGVTDYSKVQYPDAFLAAQGVRNSVYSPTVGNEPSTAPGGYPAIPGITPGQPILPRANAQYDIPMYAKPGDINQSWYDDPAIATVSPDFPLLILEQNDDGTVLVAEYTQPDRPIGWVDGWLLDITNPPRPVPGAAPTLNGNGGGPGFGNPLDAIGGALGAAGGALGEMVGGLFAPQAPQPTTAPAQWTFSRPKGTFDHAVTNAIDTETYSGSTNYNLRPAPPVGIVYHFTAGSSIAGFSDDFMGLTGRQASSNYVVDKDGTIYQFVNPDNAAWAHGDTSSPNQYGQTLVDAGYGDANQSAISIEIVNEGNASNPGSGNPRDFAPYTNEQLEAIQNLTNYLIWTYKITPDRQHLVGHQDINTTGKSDPGPLFPLETIISNTTP